MNYIVMDLEWNQAMRSDSAVFNKLPIHLRGEIIEIGAVKVKDGKVVDRFMEFIKPEKPITATITNITGITNEMVASARSSEAVMKDFVAFCEDYILVGHNIQFDYKFSKRYEME